MLAIACCRFLLESIDFIVREIIAMMLARYHLIKRWGGYTLFLQRIELLRFIIHYLQACMSIRYIMGTAWSHSSDAYTRCIAIFSLLY
ncbi:hypothetical protein EGH55_19380 [Klebsiella aerogenes]|nr:hypothetical protein EGH55_19380 [Klebsiella aerogenes]RTP00842.1 hypothetical protein EKN57_15120 [Enterobacter hormaechei]